MVRFADTRATMGTLSHSSNADDVPCEMRHFPEYAFSNRNVDIAGRLIYDDKNREIINFGKVPKGRVAEEVLASDPGYYSWIMQGDFARNTKQAFTRIKLRARK